MAIPVCLECGSEKVHVPGEPPGTVEDSHARLAAEMRDTATLGIVHDWADRVEQLGQERANLEAMLESQAETIRETRAREADIAKVRTLLIVMADHEPNDDRKVYINSLAARLRGAE